MSFVAELRRRQVFRTAAWYGGLAWAAVEVADTIFPRFGLPDWTVRWAIVTALLGLPIALALGWWFELTPAGPVRDAGRPDGADPVARRPPTVVWRLPSFWMALALGAGLAISAQQAWRQLIRPGSEARPALAVLPFANLSPDPANAYFADGLHEEILAALGRSQALRVVSRTSVEVYRDHRQNLREVAGALGVTHILEGSVRREDDQVRVSLTLIDGRSDEQLWSETFDRKLEGILKLQRTVAMRVASELGARLSPAERLDLEHAGSTVPEAYERYLQAVALLNEPGDQGDMRNAERLLGEAIVLDPGFAQAYARRARLLIDLGYVGSNAGDVANAQSDIERALELDPQLPDGLVARALYSVYISLDPAAAMEDLSRALAAAPNDPQTRTAMGFTLRRLGRADEAAEQFEAAAALAPGVVPVELLAAANYYFAKDYERALAAFDVLVDRHPEESFLQLLRFAVRFSASGDTTGWRESFDRLAPTLSDRDRTLSEHWVLVNTGDLDGLIRYYERTPPEKLLRSRDYMLGVAYMAQGHAAQAIPHLEAAAVLPAEHSSGATYDAVQLSDAAVALELLGRHTEAITAADVAVRLMPESRDARNGPDLSLQRAWVLIHSGTRQQEAYAELERLMGALGVHARVVAADPLWQLLREDQRVQRILHDATPDL